MVKNAAKQSVECLFRPYNEAYLGMVTYNVSFVRDPVFLSPLEDPLQSVKCKLNSYLTQLTTQNGIWLLEYQIVSISFPDFDKDSRDSADENKDQAADKTTDTGIPFPFILVYRGYTGSGFDESADSALKGTLKLPVKGKFLSKRYLIVDESGTDVLIGGVGEGEMKEGVKSIKILMDSTTQPVMLSTIWV